MYIGYMGDIVFAVSVDYMITPTNYERESEARWAEHALQLRKPVSQFGGPGLEKLSFDIILDADHGVSPAAQLKKLRRMRDTGRSFRSSSVGSPSRKTIGGWIPSRKGTAIGRRAGSSSNVSRSFPSPNTRK